MFFFFFLGVITWLLYWETDYAVLSRYMAPLQGVVSMDGTAVSSAAIQVRVYVMLNFFLRKLIYLSSQIFSLMKFPTFTATTLSLHPTSAEEVRDALLHCAEHLLSPTDCEDEFLLARSGSSWIWISLWR